MTDFNGADAQIHFAQWRRSAKETFRYDIENYQDVADELHCTRQEAMLLNALSLLETLRSDLYATARMLEDYHRRDFPERWKLSE